jgi:hypothetical protein
MVFNVQTSHYGLSVNCYRLTPDYFVTFSLDNFGPIANPLPESAAAFQDNHVVFNLPASSIECVLVVSGTRYKPTGGTWYTTSLCKLIESGKFLQRRWLDGLTFQSGAPAITSYLEVAAWPDRVSFILHVTPTQAAVLNGALEISLGVGAAYSNLVSAGEGQALCAADGSGFAFLKDKAAGTMTMDAVNRKCTVRFAPGYWPAGEERTVGMIVYPTAADCQNVLARAVDAETTPLTVTAWQTLPTRQTLTVSYERPYGWHKIGLRNDDASWPNNDRMERVTVNLTNPTSTPRVARLNFSKEGNTLYGITGISAVLRDRDQDPTGIPIQISKDWHDWYWFHGITMLTVPPQTTLKLEYTGVNAHWGGVAAASHAQLCLVGYGGNQLWDQAALGAWGESITFDPDVNLGRSMIDDVRPMMVWAAGYDTPVKWTWTNNVGGGDFLVYFDQYGQKQWNSRIRTQYRRQCPNLTEVTYAGTSYDAKIDVKCMVSLYRTDDIVRGVYRLRYDVRSPVSFSRLAFFQMASDNYSDNQFNLMARGNEGGLIEEWRPPWTGWGYSRTGIPCPGRVPWVSMHDAISRNTTACGAWANRGVVIRSWQARLGGADAPTPYMAVYQTYNGMPSAIMELSAPPGVSQLVAGDYADAEVVQVIMPQYATDYYGPNANLRSALTQWENTWAMIGREATGNDLAIAATEGTVEQTYPIRVRAAAGDKASFAVTGGLAYVPVTIAGLTGYTDPILQRNVGGKWKQVDQSVHGKDYWQTDFDPIARQWEITYSIPLDTPADARQTSEFRFFRHVATDLDVDGDVDLSDFTGFQYCFNGPNRPPFDETYCGMADFDGDDDVDLADFGVFQGCFNGPNRPPSC